MSKSRLIPLGNPAPWFTSRSTSNERYSFESVGGRYVVMGFYGSTATTFGKKLNEFARARRAMLDDTNLCFFGISIDPDDETKKKVAEYIPGIRYFWDFDKKVSKLYGAINPDGDFQEVVYVLDPTLRIVARFNFNSDSENFDELLTYLNHIPKIPPPYLANPQAPVLIVPYVFEPKLCQTLIDYYDKTGGEDSGFMREVGGKTVGMIDYGHKRRRDCNIEDEKLKTACMARINDRLVPVIEKSFQFKVTRMERYIVACYDAAEKAHFRAHRDNTTAGTAHRKFAVSLFLNAGEYEGGFLRFPEFGSGLYTAPTGGAVVFSCSLLHEATQITQGKRYMFLPFLYDDEAAAIRKKSASLVVDLMR